MNGHASSLKTNQDRGPTITQYPVGPYLMDDLRIVRLAIIVDDGEDATTAKATLRAESNMLNMGIWMRKALHATTESIR